MINLALIVDQIKNEISVDAAGKGKASIRAVARLIDVDHTSLLESLKTAGGISPSKLVVQYSQLILDTAKGHNKTVQSLQWYPSVIDVI